MTNEDRPLKCRWCSFTERRFSPFWAHIQENHPSEHEELVLQVRSRLGWPNTPDDISTEGGDDE